MISLKSIPDIILQGDTVKIQLNIQGQLNLKMYKGKYFNLIVKKNGGTLGNVTLYPLRFNGFPLEWEINSYSYEPLGEYGTFNVNCILQNDSNSYSNSSIISTTFIIEQKCIEKKINICNNLINYEEQLKLKNSYIKNKNFPIDCPNNYLVDCSIQKNYAISNNYKKEQMVKKLNEQYKLEQEKLLSNLDLTSSAKVQTIYKNVSGN